MEIGGAGMCGVYLGSPSFSMEPKYKFGKILKGVTFCHLAIIRHKNIKTSLCTLSKNY